MIKNLIQRGINKNQKKHKINYFDQSGQQLNKQKSIKYNLVSSGGDYLEVAGKKIHVCGYLKNFLFDPKNIDQKVESLSGGEKNRLLPEFLSDPKDLLLLDEPTNDLDIETIDILVSYKKEYRDGF